MQYSTSNHQQLLETLMQQPDVRGIIAEAQDALEQEQRKREQFYNDIDEQQKVEFINGQIVVHSPVKLQHLNGGGLLFQILNVYVRKHQIGYVGAEKMMITLDRNDYEPDICFFRTEKSKHFQRNQSLFPAPDLVVEFLSKGTQHIDRGIKYQDYQLAGVEEYWIIDPEKETVEQYRLAANEDSENKETPTYELITKSNNGILIARPLGGLELPIRAIFDSDENLKFMVKVLSA